MQMTCKVKEEAPMKHYETKNLQKCWRSSMAGFGAMGLPFVVVCCPRRLSCRKPTF